MKSLCTTAAVLALSGGQLLAQAPASLATIPETDTFEIHSEIVDADFQISVSFPFGYHQMADAQFPVLYLPDAYWTFGMATDIARVLSADQLIPPMLVVGIGYPGGLGDAIALRVRDMTLRQSEAMEQMIAQEVAAFDARGQLFGKEAEKVVCAPGGEGGMGAERRYLLRDPLFHRLALPERHVSNTQGDGVAESARVTNSNDQYRWNELVGREHSCNVGCHAERPVCVREIEDRELGVRHLMIPERKGDGDLEIRIDDLRVDLERVGFRNRGQRRRSLSEQLTTAQRKHRGGSAQ